MKKGPIIVGIIVIILFVVSFYIIQKIYIKNMISKSTYIGKEYRYTIEQSNGSHQNKREYCFYRNNQNDTIFCVRNNREIRKINNIEDLEQLYIMKINCLVTDEYNAGITYDENGKETSSYYIKNKMFPNIESDYWDFRKENK